MRLLFLTARFPFPVLFGDQVRAYHQLRILSRGHEISLLSFVDRPPAQEDRQQVAQFCREMTLVPRPRFQKLANLLRVPFSRLPAQTLLYASAAMQRAVGDAVESFRPDLIHVQLARLAPFVARWERIPRVVDLIDALSLNMQRRAGRERWPMSWMARVEAERMRDYERQVCAEVDQALVVSALDRQTIGPLSNLHVNPNGVDLERFPFRFAAAPSPTIVFGGNMGYFPNIDAVRWFAEKIYPHVKRYVPAARFRIVGAHPHPSVQQLAERDASITVTGFVPDMHAELAAAAVAVVPLRAGSGMQSKVVEAMASGVPLVVTPFAMGGLQVEHGRELLLAEDAVEFVSQTIRILEDHALRRRLATQARALVERDYSWEKSVAGLEAIHEAALARPGAARKAA